MDKDVSVECLYLFPILIIISDGCDKLGRLRRMKTFIHERRYLDSQHTKSCRLCRSLVVVMQCLQSHGRLVNDFGE